VGGRDEKRNSKFFVQLAAGKIWEKAPVGLSIVERRIPCSSKKKTCKNTLTIKKKFRD
jgi:hypothetical protein